MKLITKKGSALEQTVKEMCDKMTTGTNGALDLVEKATGIRPSNVYHIFHWGTISKLVPEFVNYNMVKLAAQRNEQREIS